MLNRWRNGDAVATLVGKARDLVAKGLLATLVELRKPLDASAEALKGGRNLAQTHYGASAAEVAADVACAATAADCAIVDGAALRPLGELPGRPCIDRGRTRGSSTATGSGAEIGATPAAKLR